MEQSNSAFTAPFRPQTPEELPPEDPELDPLLELPLLHPAIKAVHSAVAVANAATFFQFFIVLTLPFSIVFQNNGTV